MAKVHGVEGFGTWHRRSNPKQGASTYLHVRADAALSAHAQLHYSFMYFSLPAPCKYTRKAKLASGNGRMANGPLCQAA